MKLKLIGIDKSNGKDYTCKLYGYIKKGKLHITKEVLIKSKKEEIDMKWIKCSDRLPEYNEQVILAIFHGKTRIITEGYRSSTNHTGEMYYLYYLSRNQGHEHKVTDWMPSPEPPKD